MAESIEKAFRSFYSNLFTSTVLSKEEIFQCTKVIQPKVSVEMNSKLLSKFTRVEVDSTLNQMVPLKSLGPDDFGAVFCQKYWPILDKDVCKDILSILKWRGYEFLIQIYLYYFSS